MTSKSNFVVDTWEDSVTFIIISNLNVLFFFNLMNEKGR